MSKNNTPDQTGLISIDYVLQDYRVVLENDKYEVKPDSVPGTMMDEIRNRPLCYFKWRDGKYDLYVCLVVEDNIDLDKPSIKIEQIGSTYFLKLPLKKSELPTDKRILYIKFESIPRPVGFKVPSLSVKVVPPKGGGLGNEEGSKSTTVDYEDADDEVVPMPGEGHNGR